MSLGYSSLRAELSARTCLLHTRVNLARPYQMALGPRIKRKSQKNLYPHSQVNDKCTGTQTPLGSTGEWPWLEISRVSYYICHLPRASGEEAMCGCSDRFMIDRLMMNMSEAAVLLQSWVKSRLSPEVEFPHLCLSSCFFCTIAK